APEVVYSPIVPVTDPKVPEFVTNSFPPNTAMPLGLFSPEMSEALTVAPEVVYSPIRPLGSTTNSLFSVTATAGTPGSSSVISAGFNGTPEVVYSPIVPVPPLKVAPPFVTKICAQAVPGLAQSAAAIANPKRINRIFIGFLSKTRRGKVTSAG